ncbi:MAG TPA: DUF5076 domain-containing protein [Sphingomicrobium sp.]|nr:DUF5076 domain-containing protein [Sphingomicrobium sp.]
MSTAPAKGHADFLRMTAAEDGKVTCVVNPHALAADPAVFGIALADAARHGSKAWSQAVGCSEEEALERIWWALDAERSSPTDDPQQLS